MKPERNTMGATTPATKARKSWMGVLARAETGRLEATLSGLDAPPAYEYLRQPEIGMAMVRGRAEAKGAQFNLGEMTVSRCSVQLDNGVIGHGYIAGRDKRHAELAAVLDAMLQCPEHAPVLMTTIGTLAGEQISQRKAREAKTAATRVNFFTMVRGED